MIQSMQQQNNRPGLVQRIVRRAQRSRETSAVDESRAPRPEAETPEEGTAEALEAGTPADAEPAATSGGSAAHLKNLRAEIAEVRAQIEAEETTRESLKAERLHLQEVLGAQHGKRVLPRLKVEKTNGVASLVAGARMMQRIHAQAADPSAGIDGAGAFFADAAQTETFVRSHGVRLGLDLGAEANIVVHSFKGRTPLIELRRGTSVRHVTPTGEDPGDIRPGVTYDPDIPAPARLGRIVRASRTLSAHVPRPYVQIGWREREDAPLLTGIDVAPDRIPALVPEWDQRLGKAFDSGHARMLMQPFTAGALDNRTPDGTFSYEETV